MVNLSLKFVFMMKTEVDSQANGNYDMREVYCTYNRGCVQIMRGFSHVEDVLAFSFSIEGKKDHICFFFLVTGNYSPHIIDNL